MRAARRFATSCCSEQHLLRARQRAEEQGSPLFLIGVQLHRLTMIVNGLCAILIDQFGRQPQPTCRLTSLPAILKSNPMKKQGRFPIGLQYPIDAVHYLRIKVYHRCTKHSPKDIYSVQVNARPPMFAWVLHLAWVWWRDLAGFGGAGC